MWVVDILIRLESRQHLIFFKVVHDRGTTILQVFTHNQEAVLLPCVQSTMCPIDGFANYNKEFFQDFQTSLETWGPEIPTFSFYVQGILMVRYTDDEWGTVCINGFTGTEAQAACYTLGLSGGYYTNRYNAARSDVSHHYLKIWMDNVDCPSTTSHFTDGLSSDCSRRMNPSSSDCGHWDDVVLYCD